MEVKKNQLESMQAYPDRGWFKGGRELWQDDFRDEPSLCICGVPLEEDEYLCPRCVKLEEGEDGS